MVLGRSGFVPSPEPPASAAEMARLTIELLVYAASP
jgi:hypothetical protein